MTVVVEDRLRRGELVVETACFIVRQKEIFGEKAGHGQVFVRRIRDVNLVDCKPRIISVQ